MANRRRILEIYDDAYRWAREADEAGEREMASLAFEAADLLAQAAKLYQDASDD